MRQNSTLKKKILLICGLAHSYLFFLSTNHSFINEEDLDYGVVRFFFITLFIDCLYGAMVYKQMFAFRCRLPINALTYTKHGRALYFVHEMRSEVNSHVPSDVQAKKKRKKEVCRKFARESLWQHHGAGLAETNIELKLKMLSVSDFKGQYYFQIFGLHTRQENRTSLKMRQLVSRDLPTCSCTVESSDSGEHGYLFEAVAREFAASKPDTREFSLDREHRKVLRELRMDKRLVITKRDKGRATVILTKDMYVEKMTNILNNRSKFVCLGLVSEFDRTADVEQRIPTNLKELNEACEIPKSVYDLAYPLSGSVRPLMYGLPKIHKPYVPLRPILSMRGSAQYDLSKWLC